MATGLSMASVNKIKELANAREYSLALDILKEQDLSKSLNPQFLRLCGDVYVENNDYKNARRVLNMAHRLAPESKRIYFSLMELYLRCGFFDLAKTYHDLYMHDADTMGEETKQLRYIYAKGTGESLDVLSEILGQTYVHHLDYDWSFETFLLDIKNGKKDDAKILAMDYSAQFKNTDYADIVDRILKDNALVDDYFLKYATHACADNDPEEDEVREQESKLVENDWLRIYPKDPEITIMFDEMLPDEDAKLSKRKLKKMFDKMEKEQLTEDDGLAADSPDSVAEEGQSNVDEVVDESVKDSAKEKKGLFGFFGKKKNAEEPEVDDTVNEETPETTETVEEIVDAETTETVEEMVDEDASEIAEIVDEEVSEIEETVEETVDVYVEENVDSSIDEIAVTTDSVDVESIETEQDFVVEELNNDIFIKSKIDSNDSDFESVSINVDIDDSFDAEDEFDLDESEEDFAEEIYDEIPTETIGNVSFNEEVEETTVDAVEVEEPVELDAAEEEEVDSSESLYEAEEVLDESDAVDEEDFDEEDETPEDIDEERLKNLDIVFGESYVDYKELKRRRREEKKANRRRAKAEKLGLVDDEEEDIIETSESEDAVDNVETLESVGNSEDYELEGSSEVTDVEEEYAAEEVDDSYSDDYSESEEDFVDETTVEVDSLDDDFDAEDDFVNEEDFVSEELDAEEYIEEPEVDDEISETEEKASAPSFKMSMTFQTFDLEPESEEDEEYEIENFSYIDDDGFGKMEDEEEVSDDIEITSDEVEDISDEAEIEYDSETEENELAIEENELTVDEETLAENEVVVEEESADEIEIAAEEESVVEIETADEEELVTEIAAEEELVTEIVAEEESVVEIETAAEDESIDEYDSTEDVEASIPKAIVLEEEYDADNVEESVVVETDSIDDGFEAEIESDTDFDEIEETAEETVDDIFEETTEELVEESVDEQIDEILDDSVEDEVEELVEETVDDIVEETTEELVEESVDEPTDEIVDNSSEDEIEETVEEIVDEIVDEAVEEIVDDIVEETAEEIIESAEEITDEIVEETIEDSIEEFIDETSDEIVADAIEDVDEDIIEESVEETIPVLDEIKSSEDSEGLSSISALGPKYKTLNKPNWEFPVFKSELFPEYHNEVKKTENSFDTVLEQGKGALSENLEKEAALAREAEELLKSLGIDLGTMSTPKESVPKKININDSLYDDGPSREEIKAALILDDVKKDILRKLKNRK